MARRFHVLDLNNYRCWKGTKLTFIIDMTNRSGDIHLFINGKHIRLLFGGLLILKDPYFMFGIN